jgi:hypothetical protein
MTTYLGSEDGGSSTHKRGSGRRTRSEEGGYEEPFGAGGNVVVDGSCGREMCESVVKVYRPAGLNFEARGAGDKHQ